MFATIMIKYIFGILLSVLLVCGVFGDSNAELQNLGSEVPKVTQDVQFRTLSDCCYEYKATAKTFNKRNKSCNSEMSDFKIDECIQEHFSTFRCRTNPFRISKINSTVAILRQALFPANVRLLVNKCQGPSPDINYIRFSNKYYVYSLERILI